MEEQQQSFAAFVFKVLLDRSTELAEQWRKQAQLTGDSSGGSRLVQAILASLTRDASANASLMETGLAIGTRAHRHSISLHLMLRELDLLSTLMLQAAGEVASEEKIRGTGRDGLIVAERITDAISQLRLTATIGYTQAIADELRERYRTIRHDLRNPLATIRNAVALLTDETMPPDMLENRQVRAMVVRNARSLDRLIGEVLGDRAAQLRAFDTLADSSATSSTELPPSSSRQQRDDVTRPSERSDLESGTL